MRTGRAFFKWLREDHKCDIMPMGGEGAKAPGVKITCPKTERWTYFGGPFGDEAVPDFDIQRVCTKLALPIFTDK